MGESHRNRAPVVAIVTMLTVLGLLSHQSLAADPPRINDGSQVTVMYQITVPGEGGFEVRDVGRFVQGQHQMLPAVEQAVTGMHRGDKTEVKLSEDQAFGAYDSSKKTMVPKKELPAGAKTGDIIEDRKTGKQATITQMSETDAVMDYNHPLAGKPLLVSLTILEVE